MTGIIIPQDAKLRPKRHQYCILRETRGCEWQITVEFWLDPARSQYIGKTEHDRLIAEHLVAAHNDDPHVRKYFL